MLSSGHHATWVAVKTSVNSYETIQHLTYSFAFWTFRVLGIMGYRSGMLRLEFLASLSAIRIEEKIEKEGRRFWDFPSLYRVLASHDRRYNESNIRGFNGRSHVGTLNSAYWAFSTFQSRFIWAIALVVLWTSFLGWPWANLGRRLRNHRKTLFSSVYLCLFSWEGVPRQTCINNLRRKQGCKLMDQIYTVQQFFCASQELVPWERTPWHWSKHVKFRPSCMTVPQRLSFSARLTNCNVGPCWHVMAHIAACWYAAFSTFHSAGQ